MAELAVGLSKSVLVGAITKVQSAIDKESKLRQKAQGDLVFISLELEMMQAFLDDANDEMKNNLVKTWVKHVRQLAYDVEDCVENVVHLDDKPIFWRRLLPSFVAPELPLDLAVEELGKLKGRVEDVNNCYRRYSNINDTSAAAVSKLAAAVMQQQPLRLPSGGSHMLAQAREATKRQHGVLGDLTQLIVDKSMGDNHDLQLISVWGTGSDHGNTSIIRRTFNHPEICKNFTNRSWVKLMHPLNPDDLIRNLMVQFCANSGKEQNATIVGMNVRAKMKATQEDLFKEFMDIVTNERYFVVLEGLSNMVEWDAIRTFLPAACNGSCIIVSTQQDEIATLCVGRLYKIVELKKISDEHSVCALFKASQGDAHNYKNPMGYHDYGGYVQITDLVGRESQKDELAKYLLKTRANSPPIMSVLGIAGVGKSALVTKIFYERDLRYRNQYEKYYWFDVSHPFDMRDLYLTLLSDSHSERDPIEQCHLLLRNYRCLIVIDDLRSTEQWDLMQVALAVKHSKSVIIVITSDASIATYCTNNKDLIFNVKAIRLDESLYLLKNQVNRKNRRSRFMFEESEVQDLILKCGGIPKVIIATAGILATKEGQISSLNRRFMHHLETGLESDGLQDLFSWMHSMVLNPPAFLKPCIFYLSIFPQGQIIRQRRLVRRWIAEGYSRESVEMQAEEAGEMFFSELLELSIFQQVQLADTSALNDTRTAVYQVNGFIREYIMSRQMEENLVFELGASSVVTTQSRGRHLVILKTWDRDQTVFETIDFSRLRSLTVFGKWESFFISKTMKILRVLDLEDALGVTDGDLQIMLKLLVRLKFLSLRGCSEIYHMPSSLGDLRQLETLDVRGTSIITLPNSITNCQKLQYIRAGSITRSLPTSPISSSWLTKLCRRRKQAGVQVCGAWIGKLTALHTLGVVNVTASGTEPFLKELNKLSQLCKLGVSGINRRNCMKLFAPISGRRHLVSLSVQLDKGNEGCLDNISVAWAVNLLSLKLYGLGDRLPNSINNLSKLTKLDLAMEKLMPIDIDLLAKLPELCVLRLAVKQHRLIFYIQLLGLEVPSYEKVKILEIACSSDELHVTFGSKSMKNLELLQIDCSSSLYRLSGLYDLCELKQVFLKGTSDETMKTELESQLADHPKKPAVKLEEVRRFVH